MERLRPTRNPVISPFSFGSSVSSLHIHDPNNHDQKSTTGDESDINDGRDNATFESDCRKTSLKSRSNMNSTKIEAKIDQDGDRKENPKFNDQPKFSIAGIVRARNLAKKLAEKHRNASEIHVIDRLSRYLFPLTFAAFNIIYFAIVLTDSRRGHDD